MLMMVTLNN